MNLSTLKPQIGDSIVQHLDSKSIFLKFHVKKIIIIAINSQYISQPLSEHNFSIEGRKVMFNLYFDHNLYIDSKNLSNTGNLVGA